MEKGTVCVTGGRGYLASWMIKTLLEDGYSVNATVRTDSGLKKDVSYLKNLPGASERLKIFDADLSKPETFEAPIKGCVGVFHVAHPIDFEGKEPEEVLTKRVLEGSLGILQACINSHTVKKVVYTSSASAVVFTGKEHTEVLDEESWSDIDFIRSHYKESGASYFISKTIIEKHMLEFGKKNDLDVVTVIPTYIHLFELPNAEGRYICSKIGFTIEELYNFLSARYPEYKIPNIEFLKDAQRMKSPGVSSTKLLGTGFQFKYGIEEMFDDAISCCKRNNIL
nr:dihydroflavonol 4-reductase [Carthamus tinctorius]